MAKAVNLVFRKSGVVKVGQREVARRLCKVAPELTEMK